MFDYRAWIVNIYCIINASGQNFNFWSLLMTGEQNELPEHFQNPTGQNRKSYQPIIRGRYCQNRLS